MTDFIMPENNQTLKSLTHYDDYLCVADLNIDPTYQRQISPDKIRKIASNYQEDLAGMLYVSKRQDSTLWVCDGQHRATVMSMKGQELALCRVFTGITLEQEAQIFVICNTARANPDLPSIYKARLISGDPLIRAINATVNQCGYTVQLTNGGQRMTSHSIWAINALLDVYSRGSKTALTQDVSQSGLDHLAAVLNIIHATWPDHTEAIKHDIILGVSAIMRRYPDKFKSEEFIAKLTKVDPTQIRMRANYHKSVGGLRPLDATVRAMQIVYDIHRRGMYRLEPTIE